MRKKVILLLVLFLTPLAIVPNISGELDTFDYDPIFWEDYDESGSGNYAYQESNSTLRLTSNQNSYAITKDFKVLEDDDDLEVQYRYRYGLENSSLLVTSWWDSSWLYRKTHTISGGASNQTNYQLRLALMYGSGTDSGNIIYLNSHSQTDFDDIRFIASDDATELDYWVERVIASTDCYVWVEVDSIPTTGASIYIYYGNAGASSNTDGDDTFLLFDDFNDDAIDWNKWVWQNGTYGGVPVENDGNLMLNDTTDRTIVTSVDTYSGGVAVYAYIRFLDYRAYGFAEYTPTWQSDMAIWADYGATERVSTADESAQTNTNYGQLENSWHKMAVKWFSSSRVEFLYDWTSAANHTTNIPDGTPEIPVQFYIYHGDANEFLWIDWVIVTKSVYAEPESSATSIEQTEDGIINNDFRAILYYRPTSSTYRDIIVLSNDTYFEIQYYRGDGTAQTESFSFASLSEAYNQYFTVDLALDALTRVLSVDVYDSGGSSVINEDLTTEATPTRFSHIEFNVTTSSNHHVTYNNTAELVYVDAPYQRIDGMREWAATNAGDETLENPYNLFQTDTDDENYHIKVMPFQGFKTLWNWTMSASNGLHAEISLRWYKRDGTAYANGIWWAITKDAATGYRFQMGYSSTTVKDLAVTQEDQMAIAFWVEPSGRSYLYAQLDPESHSFCDFWVYEVTDYVDLDSWGVILTHELIYAGSTSSGSRMKEVEIFYGQKEGISQPRFGGMWWQYNIIFVLWIQIVTWIQTAFAVTLSPVITVINAVVTSVITIITWLSDIYNILNLLIASFFAYVVPNALIGIWLATMNVILAVLGALGTLLFGDSTVITNFIAGAAVMWGVFWTVVTQGISILTSTFFLLANLALGVPVVGVDLTGPVSWIFAIIYYVVTYAPIVVFLHLLTAIFRTVQAMDINILIDAGFFYLRIAEFMFNIVREVISMLVQGVQMIMDLIPF